MHSIQCSEWWRELCTVFSVVSGGGGMHSIQCSGLWREVCTVVSVVSGGGSYAQYSV